ncbi:MAG: hypothetical protein ACREPM_25795 [Gemmatimonadaceae bacterium]
MSDETGVVAFDRARLSALLGQLEVMAAGCVDTTLPLTKSRDELDAISHGINVLADELRFTSSRAAEA